MQNVRRRVLSTVLAAIMVTTMLVALPAKAFAAPNLDFSFETEKAWEDSSPISGAYYLITRSGVTVATVQADAAGEFTIPEALLDDVWFDIEQTNDTYAPGSLGGGISTQKFPARPTAPLGVSKTDETIAGDHDGTITGVADTMEYSTSLATPVGLWTAVGTGDTTVTGLEPGTYYERYQSVTGVFASQSTSVTIAAGATPLCENTRTSVKYTSLQDALDATITGDTIRLLTDAVWTSELVMNPGGVTTAITLDLNGKQLDIDNTLGHALSIHNGAMLTVVGGTLNANGVTGIAVGEDATLKLGAGGVINAYGQNFGIVVLDGGNATITSALAIGTLATGAFAFDTSGNGSTLQITGNVTVKGDQSLGVYAQDQSLIGIGGDVIVTGAESTGLYTIGNGTPYSAADLNIIYVMGNVTVSGTDATGVIATSGGVAVIEGTLTAPIYLTLGPESYTADQYVRDYTGIEGLYLEGYLLYLGNISQSFYGYVWIGNSLPGTVIDTTVPATGDTTALLAGSAALFLALMGAGALLLRRRRVLP